MVNSLRPNFPHGENSSLWCLTGNLPVLAVPGFSAYCEDPGLEPVEGKGPYFSSKAPLSLAARVQRLGQLDDLCKDPQVPGSAELPSQTLGTHKLWAGEVPPASDTRPQSSHAGTHV